MPTEYAPPAGPPPSHHADAGASSSVNGAYAPPPGPPPSHNYAPPPGPPPSKSTKQSSNPFGDPATYPSSASNSEPKPPQAWETAVPDTSLLPPPPNYFSGFDRSPAHNATEQEAEAGERWCAEFPLYPPLALDRDAMVLAAIEQGNINVFAPPTYRGSLKHLGVGHWRGETPPGSADACLATYPPLYSVNAHGQSVKTTGRTKTIYYEVRILDDRSSKRSSDEVTLALGFTAPPYPAFRLPGWHRASLAVHGDDGHRYVNDRWGGKTFTQPFRRGDTVGIGMRFSPGAAGLGVRVEIFFTRNGSVDGRWDLHEETDLSEDLPVDGLDGSRDLCAAVGVFEKVAFELVFRRDLWRWTGFQD